MPSSSTLSSPTTTTATIMDITRTTTEMKHSPKKDETSPSSPLSPSQQSSQNLRQPKRSSPNSKSPIRRHILKLRLGGGSKKNVEEDNHDDNDDNDDKEDELNTSFSSTTNSYLPNNLRIETSTCTSPTTNAHTLANYNPNKMMKQKLKSSKISSTSLLSSKTTLLHPLDHDHSSSEEEEEEEEEKEHYSSTIIMKRQSNHENNELNDDDDDEENNDMLCLSSCDDKNQYLHHNTAISSTTKLSSNNHIFRPNNTDTGSRSSSTNNSTNNPTTSRTDAVQAISNNTNHKNIEEEKKDDVGVVDSFKFEQDGDMIHENGTNTNNKNNNNSSLSCTTDNTDYEHDENYDEFLEAIDEPIEEDTITCCNNDENGNRSTGSINTTTKVITTKRKELKSILRRTTSVSLDVVDSSGKSITATNLSSSSSLSVKRVVSFSDENGGELYSHREIQVSPGKLVRRVRRSTNTTISTQSSSSSSLSSPSWAIPSFFTRGNKNNTTHTHSNNNSNSSLSQNQQHQQQQINQDDDYRVLILLMDPPSKQYELTSIVFPYYSKLPGFEEKPTQLQELIPLIAGAASHEPLKKQTYIGFTRPSTGVEMLNTLSISDYVIKKDEVLAAIPEGYLAKECAKFAKPILEDPRLVRLLKKLKRAQKKQEKMKSRGEQDIFKMKEIRKIDERKGGVGFVFGCVTGGIAIAFLLMSLKLLKIWVDVDLEHQTQQQILEAKPCFGNILCRTKKIEKQMEIEKQSTKQMILSKMLKRENKMETGKPSMKQMILSKMLDDFQFPLQ